MRAIPASLRLTNQGALVDQLLRLGVATRAELAKATGMSQPTAGKIIDELLDAQVVEAVDDDSRERNVGRPGKLVRLATAPERLLIVELGVEQTSLGARPIAPLELEAWPISFKTPTSEAAWTKRFRAEVSGLALSNPWGAVLSVPAMVDERLGKVLLSPNLHWLESADLPEILGSALNAPVTLIQEVKALALGELHARAHLGDFLLVDVGEGVGGAIVLGQRPYDGPLPVTGEIGHTRLRGNDRVCGCGNRGCLETLIGVPYLVQSLRDATGNTAVDLRSLLAYLDQDPLPSWLKDALDSTAACIGGALNLYGLERVVLTGFLHQLPLPAKDYLSHAVARSAMWSRFAPVEVSFAPRRRARGLVLAGIQRFVAQAEWSRR
ncbi:MAG TPA: ROK family transcriptional regulator [Polyangiaceae bacterium]|jgi:predicted NBD/HSP70 family sugar kinase|nr:ROK family transcriptional regulator [Polyangiaceae bacterium]